MSMKCKVFMETKAYIFAWISAHDWKIYFQFIIDLKEAIERFYLNFKYDIT